MMITFHVFNQTHCHDDVWGSGGIESRVPGVGTQGRCRLLRVLCTACIKRTHRGEITFIHPMSQHENRWLNFYKSWYEHCTKEATSSSCFLISHSVLTKVRKLELVRQKRHQPQFWNPAAIVNKAPKVTTATRDVQVILNYCRAFLQ
jgi:hypothetical protein